MSLRTWTTVAALGAVCALAAVLHADQTHQTVKGRLAAVSSSSRARATFTLVSRQNGSTTDETLVVAGNRFDATADGSGNLPAYNVVLTSSDGNTVADFGTARINTRGQVELRFDSRFDTYPSGVSTITAFGGGTFDLQNSGSAVVTGTIPVFVGIGDANTANSTTTFHGAVRLRATSSGGPARGDIDVKATNRPAGTVEVLRVNVGRLTSAAGPFSVVALNGSTTTTIGSITTTGRSGSGRLVLDSRRTTIPGGGVTGLSGLTIEVRTASGTAVLSATFPTVP